MKFPVMKRPMVLPLGVTLLLGLIVADPSEGATRWRDVRLQIGSERNVRTATYDPETGRIFVLTRLPFQTTPQLAAFAPGRSKPIWKRTFAVASGEYSDGMSYASDVIVRPKHHLVYVGGGYLDGTGAGPFTSAGYIYAFDTRTGRKIWSRTENSSSGMGATYDHLEGGPNGSVIGLQYQFKSGPDNNTGSYSIEVRSFDRRGRQQWRWIDKRRAFASDLVTTRGGLLVLVGEAYLEGWARDYRLAIEIRSGRIKWKRLSSDPWEFSNAITSSPRGRALYIAGNHQTDDGSRATLGAVNPETGHFLWRRNIEAPPPLIDGELSYYSASAVSSTKRGPCVTGEWEGRRALTYEPILPDDGFIACYSPKGRRRWIDRSANGQGRVVQAFGRRLLWMGRQEISRDNTTGDSEEAVRFEIRKLSDGTIRHSSYRSSITDDWEPSKPLLVMHRRDKFHFVVATATAHDNEGNVISPDGLLDRSFR